MTGESAAHPARLVRTGGSVAVSSATALLRWRDRGRHPMNVVTPAPYQVEAFNTSKASENKIHDDAVALRFGFSGGLVPGVDVYGYMTHQPVARWGRAWLERGVGECRLLKPIYDGETATVTAGETVDGLVLQVTSRGMLCATGTARLPDAAGPAPAWDSFPASPTPPEDRPPADEASLAVGTALGIRPLPVTPDFAAGYLRDVRETDPIYLREGLVHPATILRVGNWVLSHNVVLGPWIHVGSTVRHFWPARVGDEITARGRVTANYGHKGHRFVEVEVLVIADGATAVAHIAHTAIYRPRQVAG
jgi:acyl dehydratase